MMIWRMVRLAYQCLFEISYLKKTSLVEIVIAIRSAI